MKQLNATVYRKLNLCFAPESAAIIGASTDPMKFGGRALKFCLERGFGGRLYPINRDNQTVQGVQAYQHISEIPEAPDVSVIAVPAPLVKDNLVAAGEKGSKFAIVYGAQFAEAGKQGQAKQEELLAIAERYRMHLIGPNCMGVISLASGFVASFTAAPEHHDGKGWPVVGSVSVASQSGAVGIQMFAQLRDRGLGLANWISTGNQADIDVADAIACFVEDENTKTIAVYMEDASRGFKLVQALELARQARKPVVVLKVGTTPEGGAAAAGHTAAMYVEDRVVDDIFTQYGVLRAQSINELIDLVAACNGGIIPATNEVAAISVSGGGAVMISDIAARDGLSLPDYPTEALAELKLTNDFVNDRNPIDISAPSMSNMTITGGHLAWGLERQLPTMLGYISHVPLVPRTRGVILPKLLKLPEDHPDQLIAIAMNATPEDRKALVQAGVAVFDDPVVATQSVAKLVKTGRIFKQSNQLPCLDSDSVQTLSSGDVRSTLDQAGIDLAPEVVVTCAEQAQEALQRFGQIVLKLSAPALKNRTETGGVYVGLQSEEAVAVGFRALEKSRNDNVDLFAGLQIIASPMYHGVEMLIGIRQDEHFGPLIICGTGGVDCELFDDLVYRKAPITHRQANEMIDSTRAAMKLSGWRGTAAVNRTALADTLIKISQLAAELPSLEINPLIVTTAGATGVDLVVCE